jgi:alkanesulfonate monooxygenase SsuD/methylene tetrahydromethanopterin reductase-like flavin-dependent oxidoreductase (luciferase family)
MNPTTALAVGVLLWPQRTDWSGLRDAVIAAEAAGFDSIWTSDHLLSPTGPADGSVYEAWTTIAAIGALTGRVRVGIVVGSNGLRHPALVAKMAVTLDHVTGGRAVLGLGAGWLEEEYRVHGIPFGTAAERIDRLDRAAAVIRALLDGVPADEDSPWYHLEGATHAPRPVQARLPILIGGEGRQRTLRVVATRADMWHGRGSMADLADADRVLREHCAAVGRDPESVERLTSRWVVIRDDRAEAARVLADQDAHHGLAAHDERIVACGTPSDVAAALQPVIDLGFRHILVSLRAPWDHETIGRFAEVRSLLGVGDPLAAGS